MYEEFLHVGLKNNCNGSNNLYSKYFDVSEVFIMVVSISKRLTKMLDEESMTDVLFDM